MSEQLSIVKAEYEILSHNFQYGFLSILPIPNQDRMLKIVIPAINIKAMIGKIIKLFKPSQGSCASRTVEKIFVIMKIKGTIEKITNPKFNHLAIVGNIAILSLRFFTRIRARIPQIIEKIKDIKMTRNRIRFNPSGVTYNG